MNSSHYSRNDTDYHEVLLTWAKLWPQQTVNLVKPEVRQLRGCISVTIYLSPALNKTLAHLRFDERLQGFKRNFFQHGQKRKGSTLFLKCEVPVPWSKCLDGYELKN